MKFSLYYPVKPFVVTQPFGVNGAYYQSHGINILGHDGVDMKAYHGQPVYATHDGQAWYEVDTNQGHGVILTTNEQFDYKDTQAYFKTIYWHFCDSSKEPRYRSPVEGYTNTQAPGLQIKAGDLLGYADNTGLSTADHLHFGLKPQLLHYPSDYTNIEQNNGYLGNIDPTPYFNGLYAQDINVFHHIFYVPMAYGDSGPEIMALQKCLQSTGYFPSDVEITGFYGSITSSAVFKFQKDHVITGPITFATVWAYMGRRCGTYTIPALNKVFS